jgi:hypothetical protein
MACFSTDSEYFELHQHPALILLFPSRASAYRRSSHWHTRISRVLVLRLEAQNPISVLSKGLESSLLPVVQTVQSYYDFHSTLLCYLFLISTFDVLTTEQSNTCLAQYCICQVINHKLRRKPGVHAVTMDYHVVARKCVSLQKTHTGLTMS